MSIDWLPLLYDLALVCIIVFAAVGAWRSGFLSSLVSFLGWAAAIVVAALFSRPLASWTYDTVLKSRVTEYVHNNLDAGISSLSSGTVAISENLDELKTSVGSAIQSLLNSLGIQSELFSAGSDPAGSVLGQIADSGASAADAIAQNAIAPVVTTVLQILIFLILFLLAFFAIRLLAKVFRTVNHVPVLGGVNRLLGGIFGAAKGLILAYLVVLGLVFLAGITHDGLSWLNAQVLNSTYLTKALMNFHFFS